jgi:hypothetical protein
MNKDVIYIDVDDDITAIIGKIKDSKEKIVALVPPKHVGVLQSAVNLRLLDRMAKTAKKNLVVVTNNQALVALAASARIPVARNLQSKPEIADIPALAVDDGDDIIDGSDLPVGDHARSTEERSILQRKPTRDDTVETLEIEEQPTEPAAAVAAAALAKKAKKAGPKIPNFNKFRKRLFLGILAGALLIAALIWAFVFAPAATVIITADTTPEQVTGTVKLGGSAATDFKAGVISSESQQLQKDSTVQFTATGTGKTGTKATGQVVFKNCEDSSPITIASGTTLTSGGNNYVTQAAVTVPGGNGNFGGCSAPGTSGAVAVSAADIGAGYNVNNGTTFSVAGHPNGAAQYMRAVASGSIAGGDSQTITVVSDNDIQTAMAQITGQSTDAAKKAVEAQFKNGEVVIDASFTATQGTPVSSPASGAQVGSDGKATLTVPMTYTVYAFPKTALDTYLTANLTSQLSNTKNQRVYKNGDDKVGFSNFVKADDGTLSVNLTTSGQVGPQIDEASVKNSIKGMVTGTVQTTLGAIDGVQNVDVKYSYFWVNKVPSNTNKITIEFKLTNG